MRVVVDREKFEPQADSSDSVAPLPPEIRSAAVEAGAEGTSCEGMGSLAILVGPPVETETGVRFRVVEGDDVLGPADGLIWSYGAGYFAFDLDTSKPIDATISITAVDRAGNESSPVRKRVSWGEPATGCSTTTGGGSPWFAVLLALGLRRRDQAVRQGL